MDRAIAYLRTNARYLILEVLINGVLPYVVYSYAKPKLGDVNALLASMAPPLLFSIAEFVRKRRDRYDLDLRDRSASCSRCSRSPAADRRSSCSCARISSPASSRSSSSVRRRFGRPLIYEFARASMLRQSAEKAAMFERLNENPRVRRMMTIMTLVWGGVLLLQTALACGLVFVLQHRDLSDREPDSQLRDDRRIRALDVSGTSSPPSARGARVCS